MHVMKKYIDTRNATVAVIEDLPVMMQILNTEVVGSSTQELVESLVTDGLEVAPDAHEAKCRPTKNGVVKPDSPVDFYDVRRSQAHQYMKWFSSAWSVLSHDDRHVLATFFLAEGTQEDHVKALAQYFFVERDSVYRRKNRALKKFATALFG